MEWKRRFAFSTLTSYLHMGLRMVAGLIVFRIMYTSWDAQEFGFWAFLWSVLAFGILLDFGLGMTIQKTVASRTDDGDIAGVNRVVATVFWTFAAIGALIFVLAWLLRGALFQAIEVPDAYVARFTPAYYFFFLSIAISFPFGIYSEVLDGVQRIDIANIIQIVSTIANTICLVILLLGGATIEKAMLASSIVLLATGIANSICAHALTPGLSLHLRFFDLSEMSVRIKFSIAAYLIVFSTIVLTKTDQAVIAGILGIGSVTIYQAAAKVGEVLRMLATQSERLISPAAANLHARGQRRDLTELQLKSSRFLFTITTPCYILAAIYLHDLICLLTGSQTLAEGTHLTGQLLLLSIYISTITSSCGRRVMVMCGMENKLLKISIAQAGLNLMLSIAFARLWGVPGVAWATLITSSVFGIGIFVPTLKRFTHLTAAEYISFHFRGNLLALTVLAILIAIVTVALPSTGTLGFMELTLRGSLIALPYLACATKQIRSVWAT